MVSTVARSGGSAADRKAVLYAYLDPEIMSFLRDTSARRTMAGAGRADTSYGSILEDCEVFLPEGGAWDQGLLAQCPTTTDDGIVRRQIAVSREFGRLLRRAVLECKDRGRGPQSVATLVNYLLLKAMESGYMDTESGFPASVLVD